MITTTIIIIIIIIMIILTFKGENQDFFSISSLRHLQVARAHSCANLVQYIERLSCATCRVTYHMVRRDCSAIKFDRVKVAFLLALSYWLNH